MTDITIAQGDTLPSLRQPLKLAGTAVNLTGATVVFWFKPQNGGPSLGGACAVEDAISGLVRYDWQPSDTAAAGVYDAKFVATFPGSKPMSFPNKGYRRLEIQAAIAAPIVGP